MDLLASLPPVFLGVAYDGSRIPDGLHDLSAGANCQRFAYAVLAHFGIDPPPLRSSELWADTCFFETVQRFEPLDLLLFSADGAAFGAHVAIYAGGGTALHLCRAVGRPVVWSLSEFARNRAYSNLLGGKRAIQP